MPIRERPAAFRPADNREPAQAHLVQPWAHLSGGKLHIGLGPFAGPAVLIPVKLRAAHPVAQRQILTVANAHAALFRRVDHEQAAEAPERLSAQEMLGFLIDDDHGLAAIPKLCRCRQTGQPAPTTIASAVLLVIECPFSGCGTRRGTGSPRRTL